MHAQPRRSFRWYLALVFLLLFALQSPAEAGRAAYTCGVLLWHALGALSKLAGSV